jgi:hypothetical protein
MNRPLNRYNSSKLLSVSMFILLVVPFFATQAIGANLQAAAIAQGFKTSEKNVVPGALMSLQPNNPGVVELANTARADRLIGVVSENPLIELSNEGNTVQVVTSGVTGALVSDLEGEVKTGDKIGVSPIGGIGMIAGNNAMVVGTAQADLASAKTTEHFITDAEGKVHTVNIGLIPIQVNVTYFSSPGGTGDYVPTFIQDFANNVAGKNVTPVRVLGALVVLLIAFVSIAVLLYASVKSSIVSIGRNPLSEGSVRKGLLQIGVTILGILLFTLITIYLVLTT